MHRTHTEKWNFMVLWMFIAAINDVIIRVSCSAKIERTEKFFSLRFLTTTRKIIAFGAKEQKRQKNKILKLTAASIEHFSIQLFCIAEDISICLPSLM